VKFYTFILEFKGGTYMTQGLSGSPSAAFRKGAKSMDAVNVTGLNKAGKAGLVEQMKTDEITPISGLTNAWCKTALISGRIAMATVIQTDQTPQQ
jgi:hypothetical protein